MTSSKECFLASPYFSSKHDNYFAVYDSIFNKYRNKNIVFVEFGVFAGGSLFMWREFFGPGARIIGVDLNPDAEKWRDHGFEIFIGDQGSPDFLNNLFLEIGCVDVVLDDGGHKYLQQIATSTVALDYIRDGGVLLVEDTHTSYMPEFGGPSSRSFISWSFKCVDAMRRRYEVLNKTGSLGSISGLVYSVQHFESITVFNVDRKLCTINRSIANDGFYADQVDYRYKDSVLGRIFDARRELSRRSSLGARVVRVFDALASGIASLILGLLARAKAFKSVKFFSRLD